MPQTAPNFIEPCIPTRAKAVPAGPGWLHEPKLDGWRIQIVKADERVALYTRNGHDCAHRLPRLVEEIRAAPADAFVLDGELVADEDDRIGNVFSVPKALGAGRCDQISVMAFDLLVCEHEDLRGLALIHRKEILEGLVARVGLPWLSYVAGHEDGGALLAAMEGLRLEGIVSKRFAAPYRSGRRKEWVKVKCQSWLEANRERWRVFART